MILTTTAAADAQLNELRGGDGGPYQLKLRANADDDEILCPEIVYSSSLPIHTSSLNNEKWILFHFLIQFSTRLLCIYFVLCESF